MHSAAYLYQRYTEHMKLRGRPAAQPAALGRALSSAGCERKKVRKRVGGKLEEVHAWVMPEEVPPGDDEVRAQEVLDSFRPGEHSSTDFYSRYWELGRKAGRRYYLSDVDFSLVLNKMGVLSVVRDGQVYRVIK